MFEKELTTIKKFYPGFDLDQADYARIEKELKIQLPNFSNNEYYTGRQNNNLLKLLLKTIESDSRFSNIFHFVNCLDFFYSTGLKYKDKKNLVKKEVTTILKNNWKAGIQLYKIPTMGIDVNQVETLRTKINKVGNEYYSFTTKVFHQLNNNYPIWDRNVYTFFKKEGFTNSTFKSNTYAEYCEVYHAIKNVLGLKSLPTDKFDTAIWVTVDKNKNKYFPQKKLKVDTINHPIQFENLYITPKT